MLRWKGLLWQVFIPILGPILVSFLVVIAWRTGQPAFRVDWSVIIDVSPWALTFYSLTLIGATMNDFWPKMQGHTALGVGLLMVAVAVALYASFIVVWRHDPTFAVGLPVYGVTVFLLVIPIVLCHEAAKC